MGGDKRRTQSCETSRNNLSQVNSPIPGFLPFPSSPSLTTPPPLLITKISLCPFYPLFFHLPLLFTPVSPLATGYNTTTHCTYISNINSLNSLYIIFILVLSLRSDSFLDISSIPTYSFPTLNPLFYTYPFVDIPYF